MGRHNISIWTALSSCVNSELLLDLSDPEKGAGRGRRTVAAIGHRLFLQLLFLRYAELAGHARDGQLLEASKGPNARERVRDLCDAVSPECSFSPFDSGEQLERELAATAEFELCRCIERLYLLNFDDSARPDHVSLARLAWSFGLAMEALDEGLRPPARGKPYPADEIAYLASSLVGLRLSGRPAGEAADLTAFDPFCGAGCLLLALFDEFLSRPGPRGGAADPAAAMARLYGMDGRPWAADASRTFLAIRYLEAIGAGGPPPAVPPLRTNIRDNWSLGDRLLAGWHEEVWPLPASFDLAICDIASFPEQRGLWLDMARGQGALISSYGGYGERSGYRRSLLDSLPSFLAPGGMAGAILPMEATTAERRFLWHLCERGTIRRLVDFRRDIFGRSTGPATAFIYMDNERPGTMESFRYPLPPPGLPVGFLPPWAAGFVPPGHFIKSGLSLTADEAGILDKLGSAAWSCLGDFCELQAGGSTGRDEVFVVEPAGAGLAPAGLIRIHSRAANAGFDLEAKALLPLVEAEGIERYASQAPRRLILSLATSPGGPSGGTPADPLAAFPRVAAYLAGLKPLLAARSGKARQASWYRPPRKAPCARSGLTFIVGRDSAEEGFAPVAGPAAIGKALVAMLPRDAATATDYLLGILNSSLFRWYVTVLRPTPSAPSRPGLRPLAYFPLARPDPADARVKAIILLAQNRLALAGAGMAAPRAAALSVEQQIDKAVFDLYGLTQQERDMVMRDLAIADAHRHGKATGAYATHGAKAAIPHVDFDYDRPYAGILPRPYDPFDPSTNLPIPGSPHYVGPSAGPSFRFCRWAGLDRLEEGTTTFGLASIPAGAAPLAAALPQVFTARCRLDVAAGQRILIPSADPNSRPVSFETPDKAGTRYTVEHDLADNWYLAFDCDYKGVLEYRMGLDGPLTENAFIKDFGRFTGGLPTLPRVGPIEGLHFDHSPTVGDFILGLQAYFGTYDLQNGRPELIAALEAETTAQARLAFMIANRVGSCRHRAWLGYLLCTEAGLPTRYDLSAVHAWLECRIEGKWRYVDLGGTPMDFDPPADGCSTEPRIEPAWRSCDPGCVEYPFCPRRAWGLPCRQYQAGHRR